jgi:hypothetical protein
MTPQDWYDLASVYRAGADRARGWVMNIDRQQDADILDAQADRCEEIARERDGLPPVEHDHYHRHADGKLLHRHPHRHQAGATDHDPDGLYMSGRGRLEPEHPHPPAAGRDFS